MLYRYICTRLLFGLAIPFVAVYTRRHTVNCCNLVLMSKC